MRLDEIAEDSIISISAIRDNTSVNLQTELAFVTSDGILVKPFMHEDAIINFDVPGLRIEMMVVKEDEVPFFWKGVTVEKTVYDGEVYHCIRSTIDGVRLNRRNSFRVFIGETGTIMQVPGQQSFDVTIKDISATGIAFNTFAEGGPSFSKGDHVHIIFEDKEARFNIDVTARVVRDVESNGKITYGCSFTKSYPQVERYCAQKQLKKRRAKAAPPKKQ